MALSKAFVWGDGGAALTPEELAQARLMEARALAKGIDTSPVGHWSQGAARVADAIAGAFRRGALDKVGKANEAYDADLLSSISGAAFPSSVAEGGSTFAPAATGVDSGVSAGSVDVSPEIRDGIVQTAAAVGIDPVDLATAISYETGGTFDPTKAGPTTKYGQHRGLIQFGEPQAAQYGVDWNNPVGSQLGENGAVAKYLRASGVKPGMGLLDVYSAINAGAPGLYNRSDAAAGGAPGTVADKVNQQMAGHRAKALALFGNQAPAPAAAAINAVAPVQVASLEPDAGMAETMPMTAVTPTMRDAAVAEVTQPQQAPVMALAPEEVVTPLAGVQPGQPMAQPPAQDVTQVPALSVGADIPMVGPTGQPSPIVAAINQPALSPAVQQVSAALPIRQQADPNDIMVAGRDQTVQPQIPTGAASAAPARSGPTPQQLIAAMTDPRASPRTRQVAEVLYKQQAAQAQAQYEAQLKAADPMTALARRKAELEVQALENPQQKVPESVQALRIRAAEAGLQPGTPEYSNFMTTGGRGPAVQVNTGSNSNKFAEKSDELAATRLNDVVAAASNAPQIISDLNTLTELGKQIGTGKGAQVMQQLGPYAAALGIDVKGLDEGQAFQSIVERMAPAMRIPGSGAQSDRELMGFLRSLPSVANQPGGNELIARTFQAVQERKIQAAEIAAQAQSQQITWQEAERQIRELPGGDPWAEFKKFKEEIDDPDKIPTTVPGVTIRKISE